MSPASRSLPGLALASLLLGCGEADAPPGECADVLAPDAWVDGAPPRFVELWRRGGTNEGEELDQPLFAAAGPDGQLVIVDPQLGPTGVGPQGEWLGPLARSGEGPGEVGGVYAAAWGRDRRLVLLDMVNGRLVRLYPRGVEAVGEDAASPPDVTISQNAMLAIARGVAGLGLDPDGTVYAVAVAPRPEDSEIDQAVVRVAIDGTVDTVATAATASLVSDWLPAQFLAAPGAPRLLVATGADGQVAIAGERDGYRIRILRPGHRDVEICRAVTGDALRPDERGEGLDETNPLARALGETPAPPHLSAIGRLLFARDGRLWVERDRPVIDPRELLRGRPGSRYDVFDPEGRYLGEIRAPADAEIAAVSGDRVWAFETGELDETWVVAYRLERAP